MKLSELRVDRLKRELDKLELATTRNELQRRLRKQLQLHGIDIELYQLKDEKEREIQAPATSSGVDINSLLAAMMEKMQVANWKLFANVQEAPRAENQMCYLKFIKPKGRNFCLMYKKLLELRRKSYLNLLKPKTQNCKQQFCQKFKRNSEQYQGICRKFMSRSAKKLLVPRKGCHTQKEPLTRK